jgi:hypothetical protein
MKPYHMLMQELYKSLARHWSLNDIMSNDSIESQYWQDRVVFASYETLPLDASDLDWSLHVNHSKI